MGGDASHLEIRTRVEDVEESLSFLDFDEKFIPKEESLSKYEVGRAFYQLGKLHYDKADLKKAELNFQKALSCSEFPRDTYSSFKILGFLIRIASENMNKEVAYKYIDQAKNMANELGNVLGTLTAEYFYNMGLLHTYCSEFSAAKENFDLAYRKAKEENDPELLSKCLLALSTNCYSLEEYDKALDYLAMLKELLQIVEKTYLYASMDLFAGRIYLIIGNHEKALEHFELATRNFQAKKCWNQYGYILLGKGMAVKTSGHYDKALAFYSLALETIDQDSYKRLTQLLHKEIQDVNDSSVDLYLDRTNRFVKERNLGEIDFKHRFVLLEILFLLAKKPGEYFDKEQLAKSIWKDDYNPLIHDKLIYTSVSRLRKLIEPKTADGKRKYIIRGQDGYTFNPLVRTRFHMEAKLSKAETIANVELSYLV